MNRAPTMRNAVNVRNDIPKLLIKGDFQKKNELLYHEFVIVLFTLIVIHDKIQPFVFIIEKLGLRDYDVPRICPASNNGLRVGCIQTWT